MLASKKTGRPKGITGKAQVLSANDLSRVFKVIAGGNHPKRNTAIVVLSHYLGLRAKELAALKIGDVVEGQAYSIKPTLRLVAAYTKGAKHRDISLANDKVKKALQHLIAERIAEDGLTFHVEAPLFRSQKQVAFSPNTMARLLIKIYAEAGFDKASSHSGRRSLITQLAYAGYDLNSVRQIAGHSSISTTQRYIDDNPNKIADILRAI